MNQKMKYLGLLTIIPLFTIVISSNFIDEAEAKKSYGIENKDLVCGSGSCTNEILPQLPMQIVSGEEPRIDPIVVIIGIGM